MGLAFGPHTTVGSVNLAFSVRSQREYQMLLVNAGQQESKLLWLLETILSQQRQLPNLLG